MKTLLQAAIEFEVSQGGREVYKAFWSDTEGAPFMMVSARSAFMAGAAAMAELFAGGQALKVEQMPRKYFLEHRWENLSGPKLSRWIALAYTPEEAMRQAGFSGSRADWPLTIRPATPDDEKIDGIAHV